MTDTNDLPLIRNVVTQAVETLGRFEAQLLLGFVMHRSREWIIAHDDEVVPPDALARFEILSELRRNGTPMPYITGYQEFYGRPFNVDPSVLIPRPDTELIVDEALRLLDDGDEVLDLGTGSGCIAVTLALEMPSLHVTASDISEDSLVVARENAARLGAAVDFRRGSWWEALDGHERFDVIVSNPPYIAVDDAHLKDLSFEPRRALTDEGDGLSCLSAIIFGARQHLAPSGWLLVEHGWDQGDIVRRLFLTAGFAGVHTCRDFGQNERVTLGHLKDPEAPGPLGD